MPPVRPALPLVHRITALRIDRQQRFAADLEASGLDLYGRLERLAADLDDDLLERIHLRPRHPLPPTVVGNSAEQHPSLCVGEGAEFIREDIAGRTPGPVTGELDLLELPAAVLPQLKAPLDPFSGQSHHGSQKPKLLRLASMAESSLRASACCSRHWAVRRAIFSSNGSSSSGWGSTPT